MIIKNPTNAEVETLVKFNWIVDLCKIAKLNYQADYLVFQTAKEAIYNHRGCADCQLYAPQDEATFIKSIQ
jgi:hypothetical protein